LNIALEVATGFIFFLSVVCYFSWRGGFEEGTQDGIGTGVYATLANLEESGVIEVITYDDGSSIIRPIPNIEMHVDAMGRSTLVKIVQVNQDDTEEEICEEKT
jgi:Fe2+ or Zn2+ uptake regulation protein